MEFGVKVLRLPVLSLQCLFEDHGRVNYDAGRGIPLVQGSGVYYRLERRPRLPPRLYRPVKFGLFEIVAAYHRLYIAGVRVYGHKGPLDIRLLFKRYAHITCFWINLLYLYEGYVTLLQGVCSSPGHVRKLQPPLLLSYPDAYKFTFSVNLINHALDIIPDLRRPFKDGLLLLL